MIDFQLEAKVAIVTGASRGLGRAAAVALAEQGVGVLAVARSIDELQKLESEYPRKIKACPCDMGDTEAVAKLPGQAINAFGRLDILVNNAGIAPAGLFLKQDNQVWHGDKYHGACPVGKSSWKALGVTKVGKDHQYCLHFGYSGETLAGSLLIFQGRIAAIYQGAGWRMGQEGGAGQCHRSRRVCN